MGYRITAVLLYTHTHLHACMHILIVAPAPPPIAHRQYLPVPPPPPLVPLQPTEYVLPEWLLWPMPPGARSGACRTKGGNTGASFNEVWGLSELECQKRCSTMPVCVVRVNQS